MIVVKSNIKISDFPQDKVYRGEKGDYLPITIIINDELNDFGKQGPIYVEQTKEEREAREPKTYLGDVSVVYTDGKEVLTTKDLQDNE